MKCGIGQRMYNLRARANLTLEEVGERVGVSKSTVRKWESGQITNMRIDKLPLVASALGTTPEYLAGWNPIESKAVEKSDSQVKENYALKNEMVSIFKKLDPESQFMCVCMMRDFIKAQEHDREA